MGKQVSQLDSGQVQSAIRVNASSGLTMKVRTGDEAPRKVDIKEAAVYPLADEKVQLAQ
jgi:hypothetical protein